MQKVKVFPQQSLEGGIKIPSNEIRTNSGKYKKHSPCFVFLIQFICTKKEQFSIYSFICFPFENLSVSWKIL